MSHVAAPAITAENLIGVRIERLARYGEAGVGAVVAAEANSWCGFVLEVILEAAVEQVAELVRRIKPTTDDEES